RHLGPAQGARSLEPAESASDDDDPGFRHGPNFNHAGPCRVVRRRLPPMRALTSLRLCAALGSACGGSTPDLSCAGVAPQQLEQVWNVTFKAGGCSASGCHASGSRTVTDKFVWS